MANKCYKEISSSHSSLMMEAVRTSETSVDNLFTRQYNPEDSSEHKCYKIFWVISCDNVRSDYNSPIFMSASLDDVLFLLAQCAAKGGAVNLSGQSPTSGSVPCCLTWIMVLCLSASLCPPLL
jgi:hypothetical protein